MGNVKWIKITTDIFDDEKILLIESLPEADSIIVIWFKLLCLAGKMNNSGVFVMNDKVAYTDKMLATIFRRKESTVKLALETFQKFGMIEIVDDVITIPNWGKHQNLDSLEKKTDYMRGYMRDYREKQKKIACKTNGKTNSKANVSRTEEEGDIEGDIEGDKEGEIKNTVARSSAKQTSAPEADVAAVILNDGSEWRPSQPLYEEYVRLYPNVDVKYEFNKIRGWCISNPEKRKTLKGVTRFVNSWLSREQDKGYKKPAQQQLSFGSSSEYDPSLFEPPLN